MPRIRKAAVIGSGVMGSGIAAHLANVGIPTILLDMVPPIREGDHTVESPAFRNHLATAAKDKLLKAKPSPLYSKDDVELITVGNIQDHLHLVSEVDWVIEVIVENLQVKKDLLRKLESYCKPGTIVSSNTSGVSIHAMVEDCTDAFRKHFLGTHFFNPPRYMLLLEIIPHPDTDPAILSFMREFSERILGKGVVVAKDTPNFIANRIGTYGLMVTLDEMLQQNLTVEAVDQLTGPVLGRPKSATFRTLDLVGLDTFVSVARNVYNHLPDSPEKIIFEIPAFLQNMVQNQMLGDKTGSGFYRKKKTENGSEILALDIQTLQYRPQIKAKWPSLEAAKAAQSLKEKLRTLLYAKDQAGLFTWNITKKILLYSANKISEIADNIVGIDQAMKWGFNWEMGPFEIWDAIGVERSVSRMKEEGEAIPEWVNHLLHVGRHSFYSKENNQTFYFTFKGEQVAAREPEQTINLSICKTIFQNKGASLKEIGDDVACLEFHSPHQAIGSDIIRMVRRSIEEVKRNYRGLVIGNQAKNFCVGANLMMLLMEAQDENWFEIEQMVIAFQEMTRALKYSEKPVVAAPFGMTLGGGTEVCLSTACMQAAAETYMGLVEVGVGLIPGGGGNKELLMRYTEAVDVDGLVDLQPFVNRVFETIAMAKVSTSAKEAKSLGFLTQADRISIAQDHLLYDAKQSVLALAAAGYQPKHPKKIRVVGAPGLAVMKLGIYQMKGSGYISDHDEKIAGKLAYVLSGGDIVANSYVTEQYLLDLEREAFLSLCGEPKTQHRMQHMLLKGKPLRN